MKAGPRLLGLVRHSFWFEVAIWVSLGRWVTRRPAVPSGATPVPYGQLVGPMLWLFVIGSAIEVVALDLVLHHLGWDTARWVALVLGIWSLAWMAGLLAAVRTRPHVLTDDALLLRAGLRQEVVVPFSSVASVAAGQHELSSTMRSVGVDEDRLLVGVSGRTNLVLVLRRPTDLATARGVVTVSKVGIWVDDPRLVVRVLRDRVESEGAEHSRVAPDPPAMTAAAAARAGDIFVLQPETED